MEKSYYIITFPDGTTLHSDNTSWHNHASKIVADRLGVSIHVYASNDPIKSIDVFHGSLEKHLDISIGCSVFQAICARATVQGDIVRNETVGRVIGLVKDNKVIEEYNLNGEMNEVTGFRI